MDVARCEMRINNQGVHAVDRPVIEIEESRWFVVACHETFVRIDRADFDIFGGWRRLIIVSLERILAGGNPVRVTCCIQFGQIGSGGLFHLM
jgi:hypothetical protein